MKYKVLLKYLILPVLLLIVTETHQAQTVIREKIRIKPNIRSYQGEPLDTLKYLKEKKLGLLTKQSKSESEVYTTKVIMPFDGYAIVAILGSEAAGSHTLILRYPINVTIIDDPEDKVDSVWNSPIFIQGSELDFGLWFKGLGDIPAGWEDGAIRESVGDNRYIFWYNNSNFDNDYNDLIILVTLCTGRMELYADAPSVIELKYESFADFQIEIGKCGEVLRSWQGFTCQAGIVQGAELGELCDLTSNIFGDTLFSIIPDYGEAYLRFIPTITDPPETQTIVVEVKCSIVNVEPFYLSILIEPHPLSVEFSPKIIVPGDTADVIIKKKGANGVLIDLPMSQLFNTWIREGSDYGTFWVPEWGITTDEAWDVAQGFKFTAYQNIPDDTTVQSTIVVFTASGGMAGKTLPGNDNTDIYKSIKNKAGSNKIQNSLDEDEQLYGIGTITISNSSKKLYHVKASFDKDTLYAGDIANVILTRVDEEGNESNFPASTLFEVGLIEGCDIGKIVVNGNGGDFFSNVLQPITFIVNDTLTVDRARVVLRAGVNSDDSTTYVPYVSARIVDHNKETTVSAKIVGGKSIKEAKEACSTQQVQTDGYGDAYADVVADECEKHPCETNDPPKAPEFVFKPISSEDKYCNEMDIDLNGNYYYRIGGIGILENPFEALDIQACYNKSLGKWIIKPNVDNSIIVKYEAYWCQDNISKQWEKPINSTNDLNLIPADEICTALEDFRNQRELYRSGTKYVIVDVTAQHEVQHTVDYKDIFNKLYKEFSFDEKYLQLEKSCEGFKNIAQLKKDAKYDINKMLDEFLNEEKKMEKTLMGTEDEEGNPDATRLKYEEDTQFTAFRNYGNEYMIQLYNLGKSKGQEKCVKAIKDLYPGLFKRG